MHILQVVQGFPPREWTGTELTTFQLTKGLRARGHQVTVFTRTADPAAPEFSVQEDRMGGVSVVRVVNNYTRVSTFSLQYDNPFFDSVFLRLLDESQPEVVHFQHLHHLSVRLLSLAAAAGISTVATLHDFFFPCPLINLIDTQGHLCRGPEGGVRCASCLQGQASAEEARQRFLSMEKALRTPEVILTPSAFLARKIAGFFPFLEDKLQVTPLGIETIPRLEKSRASGAPLRLLYVGVLLPHKGAHVFLDALQGLPKERFVASLYGATVSARREYADRLREAARGLPVQFFDGYPHDQIGSILAQHDVLVMPMIWEETFSILTREALSAGVPVVAVRRGALPEAVHDEVNGLLFEPENPADLRRCLARLLDEPDLLKRLSVADSAILPVDDYVQNVERVYENVVAKVGGHKQEHAKDMSSIPVAMKEERVDRTGPEARLSICIPTYNGAEFLAESIQSVLAQSFTDFELLIVDDRSADATLEIARSFNDSRVRVSQNERRLGIPGNWNRCLSLAKGEYLCLFHQDDVMLPGNLEEKVRMLDQDATIGFVHSAVELVTEASAPSGVENWIEEATEDFVVDGLKYFYHLLFPKNLICAPTVMFRRSLCDVIGEFDEELGFTPDYEMWLKACVEGQIGFISQPLIKYRWHGGNASHAFRSDWGVEEMLTARCRAIEYFARRTSRQTESRLLRAAVEALAASDRRTVQQYQQNAELRVYVGELEALRDKLWNEVQQIGRSWEEQKVHIENRATHIENQATRIENQNAYIKQLEEMCDKLWGDLQRVGKSWEEQKVYIEELERERDRFRRQYEQTLDRRLRRLARRITPHGRSTSYSGEQ